MNRESMKWTKQQAKEWMRWAATAYDVVRLVEPEEQRVISGETMAPTDQSCFTIWKKCQRCENCTSVRAMHQRSTIYKLEIRDERNFWVCSRYVEIDGAPCVMETVSDITDSFLLDSTQQDDLSLVIRKYNHLLITDPLTGAYNRRFLDEDFVPSLDCCHRPGLNVNLAVMDLDNFKQINDRYGHLAGDTVLKDVARYWKTQFDSREKNREKLTVRFGGDEMLIIVCGEPFETFERALREKYETMRKISYLSSGETVPFSISFGCAAFSHLEGEKTWDALFALADRQLYDAKKRRV